MSSTFHSQFAAEMCINGVLVGNSCGTNPEAAPWLALDFGALGLWDFESIVIHNSNNFGDKLRNVEVRVAHQLPDSGDDMFSGGQLLGTFTGPGENGEVVSLTSSTGLRGRFVIIQMDFSSGDDYFELNEVTVWGQRQGIQNTSFCCPQTQLFTFFRPAN